MRNALKQSMIDRAGVLQRKLGSRREIHPRCALGGKYLPSYETRCHRRVRTTNRQLNGRDVVVKSTGLMGVGGLQILTVPASRAECVVPIS